MILSPPKKLMHKHFPAFNFLSIVLFVIFGLAVFGPTELLFAADLAVGEPVPEISCTNGMAATVFAENLSQPDGLAIDSAGNLYVAEEVAGQITQIGADGSKTVIMSGLSFPEGIAFDADDNLYVVEDIINGGSLIKRTPAGVETVIDNTMSSPEGVAIGADGTIYVTASDAEKAAGTELTPDNVSDFRTYLYAFAPTEPFTRTTLLDIAPDFDINLVAGTASVDQPSFAGVTIGPDNMIYVTSESSGITVTNTVDVGFPFGEIDVTISSDKGVFKVDPAAAPATTAPPPFVTGLIVPEGLRFSNAGYPLLIVEEGVTGGDPALGQDVGKLIAADASGATTELCIGFKALEDVVMGADGAIYVSEDTTNRVIKLMTEGPTAETPTPIPTVTPVASPTPVAPSELDNLIFIPIGFR